MEKVIYSKNGGLGIILEEHEQESVFFGSKNFIVNNTIISPGTYTDLFGMFFEPIRYVGNLLEKENCMVFSLGNDNDLFESKKYYSCFYWINENRIANKYAHRTVRDFIWKNGKWK